MSTRFRSFLSLFFICCLSSVKASAPNDEWGYPSCFSTGNLAGGVDGSDPTEMNLLEAAWQYLQHTFSPMPGEAYAGYGGGNGFGNVDTPVLSMGYDQNGNRTWVGYASDGTVLSYIPVSSEYYGWFDDAMALRTYGENFSVVGAFLELGGLVVDPVSVVDGSFWVSEDDMTVSGPKPLTVTRTYSSGALQLDGAVGGVWDFNHDDGLTVNDSVLNLSAGESLPTDASILVLDHGTPLVFGRDSGMEPNLLLVNAGNNEAGQLLGVNNYNSLGISGRTSLYNTKLIYDPNERSFLEINGAGRKRLFTRVSVDAPGGGTEDRFLLQYEEDVSGLKTLYTYDQYGFRIQLRIADNSESLIYNWIKFEYDYAYRVKALVARDGRRVEYKYDDVGDLVEVVRPDHTTVKYEYEHVYTDDGTLFYASHRLLRVDKPEGRSLVNEYYRAGDVVSGQVLMTNDFRLGRIKLQKAPVDGTVTPVTNARFFYDQDADGSGSTDIYDILGNRIRYEYGTNELLSAIIQYTKTGDGGMDPLEHLDAFTYSPYSAERRVWDEKGNLLAKTVESFEDTDLDGRNDLLSCWTATYDEFGNLLSETIWGNISGTCTAFAVVNESGEVINTNDVESAETIYTYSDDGLNLRTSMTDPMGRVTRYIYNRRGQMTASYVCEPDLTPHTPFDNPIATRTFYEYDEHGALLSTLTDDGTAVDMEDTTEVTERSRTEITPGTSWPTYGQPETVMKQYWDGAGWETLTQTEIQYNTQGWPIKETIYDDGGIKLASTSRTYDFMGRVLESTDAEGHVTSNTYDFNGNLVEQDGPRTDISDTKTVQYDFFDRPVSESVDVGDGTVLTSTTVYDGYGNTTQQIDPLGNETHFYYDEMHRLTNTVMPSVNGPDQTVVTPQTSQRYDVLDRTVETTDARGGITLTDYTVLGRPAMITAPDQTATLYEYNPDGSLAKEIFSTGNYTRYFYDGLGRKTRVASYTAGGKLISSVESVYDALHLRSTVQPNGDEIRYFYDRIGRQTRVEGPESRTERFYDSLGRVVEERIWRSETDWTSIKTGYSPGGKTLWTAVEKSDGTEQRVMGYAYDEAGNRVVQKAGARMSETGGETTYYRFNALNQIVSTEIQSATGNLKSAIVYDYSGSSLVTTAADPLTNRTVTVADPLGRTRTVSKHNAAGELLHQTEFVRNAAGDLLEQVDTVCNSPDMVNHITTLKWTYDEENNSGRKTGFIRAAGSADERIETYHYDEFGRLYYTAYPGGLQIYRWYDDAQRLKYLISSDGTVRTRYDYDAVGRLDTVTDEINNVAVDRAYGVENRLLDETVFVDGLQIVTEYAYDRSGRPTRLRLENDTAVDYAYDGVNLSAVKRMSGVPFVSSQGVTDYQHLYTARDAVGRLMGATFIDGSAQSITRDDLGRRTSVTTPWWNWTVDPQNGYDPAGNLTGYTTVDPVGTLSVTNDYDDLYHLIHHQSAIGSQQFSYDSIGNRLTGPSTFDSPTLDYSYNELNELVLANRSGNLSGTVTVPVNGLIRSNPITAQAIASITVQLDSGIPVSALWAGEDWSLDGGVEVPVDGTNHTITVTATDDDGKQSVKTVTVKLDSGSSKACLYDLRGNLVQQTLYLSSGGVEITSYRYDALNRLIRVDSGDSWAEYKYDYLNRRISKTVTTGTGGSSSTSTEYCLWSGMNQLGILDENLQFTHFRMLGEGLGAEVGSAVAVEIGQVVYVPAHDFRGNVVALVDKLTGTVAESYRYDAYGNVKIYDASNTELTTGNSELGNPWLFSGKQLDEETGLYYFTRRYYDPSVGRFVTADPLGSTDGINMYGYVGGNPLMFVDPTGLLAKGFVGLGINVGTSPLQLGMNILDWTGMMPLSTPSEEIQQLCQQCGLTYEQYMQLKTDSYSNKDNSLEGATRVKTYHYQSGYDAVLYQLDNGKYILFNRGTEARLSDPIGSLKDWITDIGQGFGFKMQQYEDAALLSQTLVGTYEGNIAFAGHSLGGGLTAMQVSVTGYPGLTLNPAGLNVSVMEGLGGNSANLNNLNNMINPGEVLNTLQYAVPGIPNAVGNQYYVMPGVLDGIFSVNPLGLHSGINELP